MKAVICTPTVTRPFGPYLESLGASIPVLDAAGWEHGTVFEVGNPYISGARATMLRKALDAKADEIVFIDHDLSWRPEDLLRLLDTPGDVVAGFYRFKSNDISYMGTIYTDASDRPLVRPDGCIRAKLVPGGFLKVTKEAVDRFMEAYPDLCYGPRHAPSVDLFNHGARNGLWHGEDYAFSRRWEEAGGDLWMVPDLDLTHHGADGTAYPGNMHQYLMRQPGGANDPARQLTQSAA